MDVRLQNVSLAEIGDTVGARPSSRFTSSIRRMGVVQPILLAETTADTGELQYIIIDGNRRIYSARKARLREIPSVVISNLTAVERAQLTLVANGFRSPNYLTEFWAIKTLERRNFTLDEVMKMSGMSDSVMATRRRLSHLQRDIFVGLRNGKVSQTNAITIAKMNRDDQESLASLYTKNGRLLKRDVDRKLAEAREKVASPEPTPNIKRLTQPITSGIRFASPTNKSSTLNPAGESSPTLDSESLSEPEVSGIKPDLQKPDSKSVVTNSATGPTTHVFPNSMNHTNPEPATSHSTFNQSAITPPDDKPISAIPTSASRAVTHVRNAVLAAQILDFSREDFLEMAGRVWDETVEQQTMRAYASHNNPLELAALTLERDKR